MQALSLSFQGLVSVCLEDRVKNGRKDTSAVVVTRV